MSSTTQPQSKSIGSDILTSILGNQQLQQTLFTGLFSLLAGLLAKVGGNKGVSVPAAARPPVDDLPDDKIIPAPPKVTTPPPPPPPPNHGYTMLRLGFSKAQYSRELFPDQYTEDNTFGLYRPAAQTVYNRRSKVWFDATPFKGSHAVQTDEGEQDGILWKPVFHFIYNGDETIVSANLDRRQDTANGSNRPIQVVQGDSVGVGFSAWDFAHGYLAQIQVGDNEGSYTAWVEIPELGLKSDVLSFSVS